MYLNWEELLCSGSISPLPAAIIWRMRKCVAGLCPAFRSWQSPLAGTSAQAIYHSRAKAWDIIIKCLCTDVWGKPNRSKCPKCKKKKNGWGNMTFALEWRSALNFFFFFYVIYCKTPVLRYCGCKIKHFFLFLLFFVTLCCFLDLDYKHLALSSSPFSQMQPMLSSKENQNYKLLRKSMLIDKTGNK